MYVNIDQKPDVNVDIHHYVHYVCLLFKFLNIHQFSGYVQI